MTRRRAVGALAAVPFLSLGQCAPAPAPTTPACHVTLMVSGSYEYAHEPDGCSGLTNSAYKARAVQVCSNGVRRESAYVAWDWTPFTVSAGCLRGATSSYGHELALR